MIEKRLVQWYAADAGIDLDIAEREIALTYVLRILADHGLLTNLAFKGGTAIRKLYLGNQGRFSLDLDFTAQGGVNPEELILDIVSILHDQQYHGLTFSIPTSDFYTTSDSCGAEVSYRHEWVNAGKFGIQISFRDEPLLKIQPMTLKQERYFGWLGIEPPLVPSLDLQEIIGEKIRAAAQRSRVRDLYDLFQLANQKVDRNIVRRIVVIKCWETRFSFNSTEFWQGIQSGKYDWADLRRLVRRGRELSPETIIQGVRQEYAFLDNLTEDELALAGDPYHREVFIYHKLVNSLALS